MRLIRNRATAEELVQDAFLNLIAREAGPDIRSHEAYLTRIARNLALNHLRHLRQGVEVSVDNAVIEAMGAALTQSGRQPVTLSEGWQTSFDQSVIHDAIEVGQDSIGAWRHGRLIFHAKPLRDVLSEISRYRGGRIVIWEDAIGDVPVTAVFDAHDPDAALNTIVRTLGLRVLELPIGIAILYT